MLTTDDPDVKTYAYNAANELTKMTWNGVLDFDFTYDDWGRTVTRQVDLGESTLTTTYQYMYGDKLKDHSAA